MNLFQSIPVKCSLHHTFYLLCHGSNVNLVPSSYCKAFIRESYSEISPDSATSPMWFELYHTEWSKAIILWRFTLPKVLQSLAFCFVVCLLFAFVLFYWDKVLYIPGWPGTIYVAVYDLELLVQPNVWIIGMPSLCSAADQIQGFMYFWEKCSSSSLVFLLGLSLWISSVHSQLWLFLSNGSMECISNFLLILEKPLQFDQATVSKSEPRLCCLLMMTPWTVISLLYI